VVHTYNPPTWESEKKDYEFEASLSYIESSVSSWLHSKTLSQKNPRAGDVAQLESICLVCVRPWA
jgi:hypothetical protein